VLKAQSVVEPAITDGLRDGDPDALAVVDDVVRTGVLDGSLVRVKIWDADGQIIYSDAAELIGETYPLGEDEQEALRTGRIEAEVSDLERRENRLERAEGKLLEVYLPVGGTGPDALLFEAYYRYDGVAASGSRLWRSFAPISLGGLTVLALIQLPLAWSLARRLRERLREREALTWRALEASEGERRQIASDLHDGVVQQLTGIAYEISAAAVRAAATGDAPLDPRVARVLLDRRQPEIALSVRETEVIRLVSEGLANKQIARRLGFTERTVKAHLTSIFSQIGVTDRTQAALWANQHLTDDGI
jgi:DNA-binding CsgD family transcriptional regulator